MAGFDDERWVVYEKHMAPIRAIFGKEKRKAIPVFEDAQYYDKDQMRKLNATLPDLLDTFNR